MMTETEQVEVLIVEDDPNDYELTERALQKINLANQVYRVKDGAEALDFIFCTGAYENRSITSEPKIIFLDLKLPRVSGMQVLEKIKSDERTRHIPVIMLTSSQEESDMVESYKLGVNSYLVKPVDFQSFMETISNAGFYWMVINKTPPPG